MHGRSDGVTDSDGRMGVDGRDAKTYDDLANAGRDVLSCPACH